MNPTSYTLPAIKNIDMTNTIDNTLLVSSPLYNQNEFSISWARVTDAMNLIVTYLKTMINELYTANASNAGALTFNDNLDLWTGTATLIAADCYIEKYGNNYLYTFTLRFKLN